MRLSILIIPFLIGALVSESGWSRSWFFVKPAASGPFTCNGISNNGDWIDFSDATTVNAGSPSSTDQILVIRDKSGNGHDYLNAGSPPTWVTSSINGLAAGFFQDGTSQYLQASTSETIGPLFSFWVVIKPVTVTQQFVLGGGSWGLFNFASSFTELYDGSSYTDFSTSISTNTAYSFFVASDGNPTTGTVMYKNWSSMTKDVTNGSSFSFAQKILGTTGAASSRFLNGYIGELCIWNKQLSGSERSQVQAYSVGKWGV
jgi:hypothetical protein